MVHENDGMRPYDHQMAQEEEPGLEAMCYGALHPLGKRLPAERFGPDVARPNRLSEYCRDCEAWERRKNLQAEEDRATSRAAKPKASEPTKGATTMKTEKNAAGEKLCSRCHKPGTNPSDDWKGPWSSQCGGCRRITAREYYAKKKGKSAVPAAAIAPEQKAETPKKERGGVSKIKRVKRVRVVFSKRRVVDEPGKADEVDAQRVLNFLVRTGKVAPETVKQVAAVIRGLEIVLGPDHPEVLALDARA